MSDSPDVPLRFRVDFTGVVLLGVYRVDEKLADGGMGSIYLAEDTNLGRRVVVKVPHPRFLGEPGFRARFSREVAELVRLEHPNIVRILAQGEHEEIPFFVLQYLGGGSLQDRLAERGRPVAPRDVASWLVPIASTLDFVHAQGVVHRDVKPANVLFDGAGHVFLSDFGVAKVLSEVTGEITATGTGLGSPLYMAPEQGTGRNVGPAADQYGLAAIVYQALAGRPAWEGDSPLEMLVRKTREEPTPLAETAPQVPEKAAAAVLRALSREPEARFGSCREFADAYVRGLDPAPAAPAAAPAPATSLRPALIGGAVLLLVALGLFLFRPGREAPTSPGPAPAGPGPDPFGSVTIVDHGSGRRDLLRYDLAAGESEQLRVRIAIDMTVRAGGQEMPASLAAPMTIFATVAIDEVTEEEIRYRLVFEKLDLDLPGGKQPEGAAFALLRGATAVGRMSRFGMGKSPELDAEGLEPEAASVAKQMLLGFERVAVPLPPEPVGVGARWELTEVTDTAGMRLTQTATYELVERTGDTIRLRVGLAQTAPPQGYRNPLFPDVEQEVESFHASGKGEGVVDLGRMVPVSFRVASVLDMKSRVRLEEEEVESELHLEMETETGSE